MAMRNGLEIFGKDGEVAMKCELQQLHDRNVMVPVKNKELTNEQKGCSWLFDVFKMKMVQ